MMIPKRQIAAAVKHVPVALTAVHLLWRLTRPRFTAGVIGVLINPLGQVLIVEHVFHTYPQWGLPGGYVDRGEALDFALARELREELQLEIEVGPVVAVERAFASHIDVAYLCHSRASVGKLCSELLDYRWVAPDQLPEIRPFHHRAILQALALSDFKV
jgi:8-oxo-dGTP diphosphatase